MQIKSVESLQCCLYMYDFRANHWYWKMGWGTSLEKTDFSSLRSQQLPKFLYLEVELPQDPPIPGYYVSCCCKCSGLDQAAICWALIDTVFLSLLRDTISQRFTGPLVLTIFSRSFPQCPPSLRNRGCVVDVPLGLGTLHLLVLCILTSGFHNDLHLLRTKESSLIRDGSYAYLWI